LPASADLASPPRPSYRRLFSVPGFLRLTLGTLLGRTANQLLLIGIVLFVLQRFRSPALAGVTVFAVIFPGLLVSPVAGALLDRHGRVRLILVDQLVAAAMVGLVVLLDALGRLTPALLVPLVAVGSLTGMLSAGGIRSLFPILLPRGFAILMAGLLLLAFARDLATVAAASAFMGLAEGPINVSFFSLRQRRTASAWLGRAMAVSMSLNFAGAPLGSALGGPILRRSITLAFVLAAGLVALGTALLWVMIPWRDEPPAPDA
jgi:hypothetical protein